MKTFPPMDFEEWWEKQGGDDAMSERLERISMPLAKILFREAFLTGVALGLEKLLPKEES